MQNFIEKKHDIILNILPSTTCNMRCSYCYFCKTQGLAEKTKRTRQAILDGTYLKNIEKVFDRYGYCWQNVKEIQLWGGETTINLDVSKEFFRKIINNGKNIDSIGFSSNGIANADALCELTSYLDTYLDRPFSIAMQISCDGPDEILEKSRGIKFKQIDDNLQKLIKYFNNHKLVHIKFELHFKATFSIDMLRNIYKNKETCIAYWNWWNTTITNYKKQAINGNFIFNNMSPLPAVGIVIPVDYTQEDGIDYASIMRKHDAYNIYNEINKINNWKKFDLGYCDPEIYENPYVSLCKPSLLDSLSDPIDTSCNQCNTSLIIDEDGNLYPCTSAMLMYDEASLNEMNIIDKYQGILQRDVIKKSLEINPIKASDEKWVNWQYNVRSSMFNNFAVDWDKYQLYSNCNSPFLFVSAASYTILDYLAKVGLVADIYKYNDAIKIKHARAVCGHSRCVYNNLLTSGSPFIYTIGEYKLLCNGALEYVEDYYRMRNKPELHQNHNQRFTPFARNNTDNIVVDSINHKIVDNAV